MKLPEITVNNITFKALRYLAEQSKISNQLMVHKLTDEFGEHEFAIQDGFVRPSIKASVPFIIDIKELIEADSRYNVENNCHKSSVSLYNAYTYDKGITITAKNSLFESGKRDTSNLGVMNAF